MNNIDLLKKIKKLDGDFLDDVKTSIEENKASIQLLKEEVNGQRLRGIEIANSLLEKL